MIKALWRNFWRISLYGNGGYVPEDRAFAALNAEREKMFAAEEDAMPARYYVAEGEACVKEAFVNGVKVRYNSDYVGVRCRIGPFENG
jgi:hypothetical protein